MQALPFLDDYLYQISLLIICRSSIFRGPILAASNNFSEADFPSFYSAPQEADWETVNSYKNVSKVGDKFYNTIFTQQDTLVPVYNKTESKSKRRTKYRKSGSELYNLEYKWLRSEAKVQIKNYLRDIQIPLGMIQKGVTYTQITTHHDFKQILNGSQMFHPVSQEEVIMTSY